MARLPNPAADTRHRTSPPRSRARAGAFSGSGIGGGSGRWRVGRPYCSGMRYRYVVRIGPEDVGQRVVVRWRRPAPGGDEVADVVGPLEAADEHGFAVRNRPGELVE